MKTQGHSLNLNQDFNFFIGLDQTGAVLEGGLRAKPLPVAFLDARAARPKLIATSSSEKGATPKPLKLTTFSKESLLQLLASQQVKLAEQTLASSQTAILADAVFGLPQDVWPNFKTLRSFFEEAASETETRKGYGLKPAADFFSKILNDANRNSLNSMPYPVRDCETLANANSVFRTHPFQKNIQCGTYRFWRDLGLYGSEWIHFRYFERAKDFRLDRPLLFEAYPSLIWREALSLRTRDRTKVREALKLFGDVEISEQDVDLMERDADHADACILALGGYWLAKHDKLITGGSSTDLKLSKEGWIAGLSRPAST